MSTPSTAPGPRGDPGTRGTPGGTTTGSGVRAADRWRLAGLAVLGVWAVLLVLAVALWARIAVSPGSGDDVHGYLRLFGAPFVLLALGILWWVWRSARHLRHRRPEGWTLPLALGGVALVQSLVTAMPLAVSSGGASWDAGAPFLAGAVLGAVSVAVGLLGRRSWRRLEVPVSDPA